jgi:DNA-binding response OmpR family regulator
MRLLLIEDNADLAGLLAQRLAPRGLDLDVAHTGEEGLAMIELVAYAAVLLDLGLPDLDGLEVLRRLRRVSSVPVLVLTARGDERSVVRGLRGGADDYVVKPVRLRELLARIEAVHRRVPADGQPASPVVQVADVSVDLRARTVRVADRPVELTTKEFEVLAVLARRPGAAVSRQQIMDEVWGDAYLAVSRSLDVHMTSLRAKLDRPELVSTIRGFGYRLG